MDSLPKTGNSLSTVSFTNPESCSAKSGKNSNSAHCLSPGSREQLRQELRAALKAGTLAARHIELRGTETLYTRLIRESVYLDHNDELPKGPRPAIMIIEDVPSRVRSDTFAVGILEPDTLAAYKGHTFTDSLRDKTIKPDELDVKCLPDSHSLQEKMRAQAERIHQVYPAFTTSGHLLPNGTFKPPKVREKGCQRSIEHSEWLTTGYTKSQIKCFFTAKDTGKSITDHLHEKHQLEKAFGIGSLPWLVYSEQSGSAEVYFEDELSSGNLLALNEARLGDFALSHNISEDSFKWLLNLLPMPLKVEILNQQLLPMLQFRVQEIIKLVTDPDGSSPQRLRELINQGFPVARKVLYQGKYQTIPYLLIESASNLWPQDRRDRFKYGDKNPYRRWTAYKESIVIQLSTALARCGVFVDEKTAMDVLEDFYSPRLCCHLKALGLSYEGTDIWPLICDHPSCNDPAVMLEFHQRCQRLSSAQLQEAFHLVLRRPFEGYHPYKQLKNYLLALFHFGKPNEQTLSAVRKKIADTSANGIKKSLGTLSTDDYIYWVKALWERRDQESFYQQWPEKVKAGEQQIIELQKSLGLTQCRSVQPDSLTQPEALQFLVNAFSVPPVLPNARDNEETILKILQHYYRRPGPERVIRYLGSETLPGVWKPDHNCSHVLRARNNLLWYVELLEKSDLMHFSESEKNLLSLAIIYHDAAAEDVPKKDEEDKAALYFKRDLRGQYPQHQLNDIAEALARKEDDVQGKSDQNLSPLVRGYLHVLRFADRMDFIRFTGFDASFPGFLTDRQKSGQFDPSRLDLPSQLTRNFTRDPALKPDLQQQLEAAMHGAADLLQVTGGDHEDLRTVSYVQTFQLQPDRTAITDKFEQTPLPLQNMEKYLDDNVRRYIASRAGINTCSSPDHTECKTDQKEGITRGIHNSFHDLRQVKVPERMTRLEKMQCRHGFRLLSIETQLAVIQEVHRLQSEGILMSLGTLTQKTLKSRKAKRVLEQRGFAVVKEKRFRGYDDQGKVNLQEMLVPVKLLPDRNEAKTQQGWLE
ncbi:hypothetical protein [Endozoicomonas sp. 8E]|uniref:hypothetical protein n=1 Tax=Endozoicomonas sp. 8E TaxID=3035692 RepID=UPI002939152C|nr:hypothetical protein [Endozoicomonas sp. 8E]WOG25543.1 hypothetical protein P6910_13215 [Endozoicomonas sp. 8E]